MVGGRFKKIGLFFWAPGDLFKHLKAQPDWLTPFLLVCLAGALLSLVAMPYALRLANLALPEGLPEERLAQVKDQIALGHRLGILLTPLIILAKNLFASLIFTLLTAVFIGRAEYRKSFSIFNYLGLILVLSSAVNFLVLKLKGLENLNSLADLQNPLGLDLLFGLRNSLAASVLSCINFFEIWYLILLILAVKTVFACGHKPALAIGLAYWLLSLAVQVGSILLNPTS